MNTFSFTMRVALLKCFLFVFLASTAFAAPGILDKKITLNISNKGLKNVLSKIEEAAAVKFAYATQTIPLNTKVSIDAQNERLGDVLTELLSPYKVTYEVVGNQIIISKNGVRMVISSDAFSAAFKRVTGVIRSADGSTVPGVTVTVKGLSRGVISDANGAFAIEANEGAVLVFTAIGFETQEVAVGAAASYDIVLQESKKELAEVVVTALGVRKEKRSLGFSVTEIKGTELAATNK